MRMDPQIRKVILDSQAAIDLLVEQFDMLRRSLDGILAFVPPMPPVPSLVHASQPLGTRRRRHKKGPRTTLHIVIDGSVFAEPLAKVGLVKAASPISSLRISTMAAGRRRGPA
jgi:hypothetical protein